LIANNCRVFDYEGTRRALDKLIGRLVVIESDLSDTVEYFSGEKGANALVVVQQELEDF